MRRTDLLATEPTIPYSSLKQLPARAGLNVKAGAEPLKADNPRPALYSLDVLSRRWAIFATVVNKGC